jgi:signal peptidase I
MKRPLRFAVFGVAFLALIVAQPFRLVMISGDSMNPTLTSGNLVLASKLDTNFHRGDVVVFKQDDETLVKRVAFAPGDKIFEFEFGNTWVAPGSDFVLEVAKHDHYPTRWTTIRPGQLFVLGDNYDQSVDSRTFGPISISSVLGKALVEPKTELIRGFAGSALVDEFTTQVVLRRVPTRGRDVLRAKAYLAKLERTPRHTSASN